MERQQPERVSDLGAEAMNVRSPGALPVDERHAELEAALGLSHERGFVDAEQIVEGLDVRHGGLADTHGAELFGFDPLHLAGGAKHPREGGRY